MGYNPNQAPLMQQHVIDEKDAMLERQPWWLEFEPQAQVGGGATATVEYTVAWRDFVWTRLGFTSETVGFPAGPGRWKAQIEDVGAQRTMQPFAFDLTAAIGGNFGTSDNTPLENAIPWVFMEKTVIRVQLQNRDPAIAALPSLVMHGFLTHWKREAAKALRLGQLELAIKERQAGAAPGPQF